MISVVVRTKNEEFWIGRCLRAVTLQDYPEKEILVVDSGSADSTLDIVKDFNCTVIRMKPEEFTYGKALNLGFRSARGNFLVSLSAHCIPLNNKWLDRLLINFDSSDIAGVYGRQEPLSDSDAFDKRDLWITFGLDRKIQVNEPFFHNANSMIRRDIWESFPFAEGLSGVEDRDWAKRVLEHGHKIIYDPWASVYHYHGIHQKRDEARCKRVVEVIEKIENKRS